MRIPRRHDISRATDAVRKLDLKIGDSFLAGVNEPLSLQCMAHQYRIVSDYPPDFEIGYGASFSLIAKPAHAWAAIAVEEQFEEFGPIYKALTLD